MPYLGYLSWTNQAKAIAAFGYVCYYYLYPSLLIIELALLMPL